MADLLAFQHLVGNAFAGAVFGFHVGGVGADTVNLANEFRLGRYRVVQRKEGEFD
jgi:hypothetical protein